MKRRKFLLTSGLSLSLAAALGYKNTIKKIFTNDEFSDNISTNSLECEVFIENNTVKFNDKFSIATSLCNGCTTFCSVRALIDNNKVIKTFGNPYSLLSSDPWLDMQVSLKDSFLKLNDINSLNSRSTCCARGSSIHHKMYDEFRVTKALKRVGKRGENKWKSISIEELINEIVNGGNLFNEGYVDGLKSICNTKKLIDENNPDYGPVANQLCILGTADEGRQNFLTHRFAQSFGTINYLGHTAICGLSMRAGEAAYLDDFTSYAHLKPDYEHCKFLLNIATAPAQAGNPFKRQAHLLAQARTYNNLKYVCVTPNLTNADSFAVNENSRWIAIKPGEDLAFVMAMLRVIIENKFYNEKYLQIPSLKSQIALNDVSFTNASYLVCKDKNKEFLKDEGSILVIDSVDNKVKKADFVLQAILDFNGEVEYKNKKYQVQTSFNILKENSFLKSVKEYAKICDVKEEIIFELAKEFCSYGRCVATDCHGGTMHTTGFYTAYAIMMLGAMVGNLNHKGGMSVGGGKYASFNGKCFNLLSYKGKVKPFGTRIDRARKAYETSTEFKNKIKNNQNPYPAKDKWFAFTNALENEVLSSSANAYPYKLKALITWGANIVYGQNNNKDVIALLKDPSKAAPLFIAIDPFINETSIYADYIVPDSVLFETWGVLSPWAAYNTKTTHLRYPIVKSPNDTFKNQESICMDSFIIELAKALKLPSFGKNAIMDNEGNFYDLDRPQDFYLRAFLNVAMDEDELSDISDEELKISSLLEYKDSLKKICKDKWRKVAFLMSRGGRFAKKNTAYKNNALSNSYTKAIAIYNEKLGTSINSLTGKRYNGSVKYYPQSYADGSMIKMNKEFNLLAFSYKSNIFSSASATVDILKEIKYATYADINTKTAKKYNIKNADKIKISTKDSSIIAYARLKEGIYPNAIGIEYASARRAEGARDLIIDNVLIKAKKIRQTGVYYNRLGLDDISRLKYKGISDFVVGSNARTALAVKIEKI